LAALVALAHPASAQPDDAGFRQCRNVGQPLARLACYDALSLPPARAVAAPAPASAASSPAGRAPAPADTQFGLPAAVERVQTLITHYEGLFEGWRPNDRITLANGQVWQVVDDSRGVYYLKSPRVTIRKGAFGRFVLDIDGAAQMPGVRRIQ